MGAETRLAPSHHRARIRFSRACNPRSLASQSPRDRSPSIARRILLPPNGVLRERAARLGYRIRPFGGVDVAVGVDGHALARRALIHPVVAFERRDERGDAVRVDRADPDAVTPVRVVVWA